MTFTSEYARRVIALGLERHANDPDRAAACEATDWLVAALDAERARAEGLADCDCVPCPISSKACRKCGRIATIPQEQMVRGVAELQARIADLEAVAEAARALNAAHGDLLGLPTLSQDELDAAVKAWAAFRAALAVLEEPQ